MGVDFNKDSMAYDRYDNLIVNVVEFFNGISNINISKDRHTTIYGFGFINTKQNEEVKEKFSFKENVPKIIQKWCNNPYGKLTKKDVIDLYNVLTKYKSEIKMFDNYTLDQMIDELDFCIKENLK